MNLVQNSYFKGDLVGDEGSVKNFMNHLYFCATLLVSEAGSCTGYEWT